MRRLSAPWMLLVLTSCTAIERREYATVARVAPVGIPGGAADTTRRPGHVRWDAPDATVDVQVLGSKGGISFVGPLLPDFKDCPAAVRQSGQ